MQHKYQIPFFEVKPLFIKVVQITKIVFDIRSKDIKFGRRRSRYSLLIKFACFIFVIRKINTGLQPFPKYFSTLIALGYGGMFQDFPLNILLNANPYHPLYFHPKPTNPWCGPEFIHS